MNVPPTWSTSPSVNTPRTPSKLRRAKQISGTASATKRNSFMAHNGLASSPQEILSSICRLNDAVQKKILGQEFPEATDRPNSYCSLGCNVQAFKRRVAIK
jgi:hypothetical protein